MSRRFYNLPPLTTLAAFEAAARHLSFKNAAEELSVTPGAVSHQIKALEADLGTALFDRRHRGVELTDAGRALFEALTLSFSSISQTLREVRGRANANSVSVGSTTSIASLWLLPAITRFWRQHPTVTVNQIAQDQPFRADEAPDLFIRYGQPRDSRLEYRPLYRDTLVPVAAPDIAEGLADSPLATLAAAPLIHLDSEDRTWHIWQEWFAELGHAGAVSTGLHVNNYAIALQAAEDGAGVALGWRRLIAPLLQADRLRIIPPYTVTAPHRFYLVTRPADGLSESARILRDWIIADAAG